VDKFSKRRALVSEILKYLKQHTKLKNTAVLNLIKLMMNKKYLFK
jgi:hypothetical protein